MDDLHKKVIEEFEKMWGNIEQITKMFGELKGVRGATYEKTTDNGRYIINVHRIGLDVEYTDLEGNKYRINLEKK